MYSTYRKSVRNNDVEYGFYVKNIHLFDEDDGGDGSSSSSSWSGWWLFNVIL